MSLVKYNDTFPSFNNLWENFFGRDMFDMPTTSGSSLPAVNIKENDNEFAVEVAAPGMKKDNFHVTLENNVLTISSEKEHKKEEKDKDGNYTRREFSYQSFRRSFVMPDSVEAENIKATYNDGILNISLPKKEEAKKKPLKTIEIS